MARRRFLSLDEGSRPRSPERVLSRRGDLQGCAQPLSCPFFPLLPMYIFLPHEGCGVNDIFSSAFRKSYTYIIYTIRGSTIHHLKTANIYNASTKRPFTSYLYIDKDSVVPNRTRRVEYSVGWSTITYRCLFKYSITYREKLYETYALHTVIVSHTWLSLYNESSYLCCNPWVLSIPSPFFIYQKKSIPSSTTIYKSEILVYISKHGTVGVQHYKTFRPSRARKMKFVTVNNIVKNTNTI